MSNKKANQDCFLHPCYNLFSLWTRTTVFSLAPCVCVTVWKLCPNRWREGEWKRETDKKEREGRERERERPAGLILLNRSCSCSVRERFVYPNPSPWTSHLLLGMAMSLRTHTGWQRRVHEKKKGERCGGYRTRGGKGWWWWRRREQELGNVERKKVARDGGQSDVRQEGTLGERVRWSGEENEWYQGCWGRERERNPNRRKEEEAVIYKKGQVRLWERKWDGWKERHRLGFSYTILHMNFNKAIYSTHGWANSCALD